MKKLYYAHPVDIYNTAQETRDLVLMSQLFGDEYDMVNPNSPRDEEAYQKQGMDYFINQVIQCDLLVFRGYPTGMIPAGVSKEVAKAIEIGIPVIELPSMVGRTMSVEDTRQFMKEIGTR